jgi:hypothetical protein
VVTSFFFTIAGVFCVSEGDGWPRQAATGGWLKPGAVRSFWLALGMLGGSAALYGFLYFTRTNSGDFSEKAFRGIVAAFAYPAMYLSLAVLIGRLTPLRKLGEPAATRIGFVLSVVFGVAASMAAALVVEGRVSGKTMNALNPLVGMVNFLDSSSSKLDPALGMLCAVTMLCTFLAAVLLHGKDEVRSV